MERIFSGAAGRLHISEPEMYVNNEARKRSGHMSHAMVEYAPGKILDFNSNCSGARFGGHSAFGFIEYRRSEDGGRTWSAARILPYSMDILLEGIYTVSVEKAVVCGGVITLFLLRNTQQEPVCCEPWDTPQYIQSRDFGMTWTEPEEFSPWKGRIYDAVVRDGAIYVLEFCNEYFVGEKPEDVYRLFRSDDNGKTFAEVSAVGLDAKGLAYGALQFRPDGSLLAYACHIGDGYRLPACLSRDCGKTWEPLPVRRLDKGIRNIQVSRLGNGYVMHGRAYLGAEYGKGLVVYTSADGIEWDEGILLEPEKLSCYYSNNLLLKDDAGRERLLVQYSDAYWRACVNVMHMWLTLE